MTYGYPPPPRDWRAPGPDDEEPVRPRQPPAEPPTGSWGGQASGGRRIPQPPPPARHVPPAPGQQAPAPAQPPYSPPPRSPQPYSAPPRSPQPYTSPPYSAQGYPPPAAHQAPPRPTSPPPSMRRPPPNNQPGQPKGYPNFPPSVPTSPRIPPQGTGALRTGGFQPPTGPLSTGAMKPPGASRNFAPPAAPNRSPAGKPGTRSPARPALPPLKSPRSVSFKDVPGLIKQLPQHKPWMITIGAIAVAVVVAICGMGSYLLVKDDSEVVTAPSPESTVAKRDIASRDTDPNPLTAEDVFPAVDIVVDTSIPPYKRQGDAQVADDCRIGANGEVGKLLVAVGCNQVVRATFASTDGAYLVTAGIMNLPDATVAGKASTDIKGLVEANQGRFTGYISDRDANLTIGRAPTNLNWEVRGHFIVYSVIAKVDGGPIEAEDAGVKVIVYDIVQKYLRDHVILEWSIEKASPSASPSA